MPSRIPVLAGIDPLDSVTTIDNLVVGAEQTARYVMRAGELFLQSRADGRSRSRLAFPETDNSDRCASPPRPDTACISLLPQPCPRRDSGDRRRSCARSAKFRETSGATRRAIDTHFHLRQVEFAFARFDGRIGGNNDKCWRWPGSCRRALRLVVEPSPAASFRHRTKDRIRRYDPPASRTSLFVFSTSAHDLSCSDPNLPPPSSR